MIRHRRIWRGRGDRAVSAPPPCWAAVEFDNAQPYTCCILMNSGDNTYFPNLSLLFNILSRLLPIKTLESCDAVFLFRMSTPCPVYHLVLQPPTPTQPSVPSRSVNEYLLQRGRQRRVWLTPIAEERVGVPVKL